MGKVVLSSSFGKVMLLELYFVLITPIASITSIAQSGVSRV